MLSIHLPDLKTLSWSIAIVATCVVVIAVAIALFEQRQTKGDDDGTH
jgi:hypothetical protein